MKPTIKHSLLLTLLFALPALGTGGGGHDGHGHDATHKPGVGGHGKVSGSRSQMQSHASAASTYMNQMANFGKLMNPEVRRELNNSITILNQGSKTINDLVNKEGYDPTSATKEYQGLLNSFKNPDLDTLQTRSLEDPQLRGVAGAAASAYSPKNEGEAQLMGVLAENGYAPTEANMRMLQLAASDSDGSKLAAMKASLDPGNAPQRMVVVMSGNTADNRLQNLDAIANEASAKREVKRELSSYSAISTDPDAVAAEGKSNGSDANGVGDSKSSSKLVTEAEAEEILTKQLGSKAEAKAILARLKKDAKENPSAFSKLFNAFQDQKLAEYLANRKLQALSAHDALARVMRDTASPAEEPVQRPMGLIVLLVVAAIVSYFSFSALQKPRRKTGTRQFVVREQEPRWATWLKREAIPPAPKSSQFQKNKEKRPKAS